MSAGDARTILAFDYGLRRVGVAIGNTLTATAAPLETLTARDGDVDWSRIAALLSAYSPRICVVGIPYNMDGSETRLTPKARAFATRLGAIGGVEIALVDERLSSRAAEGLLRERRAAGRMKRRVRGEDIDPVAAAVLLMQWLRERGMQRERAPEGSTRDLE